MLVLVRDDYDAVSREAARRVAELVRRQPDCVLGLATGGTPRGLYEELIRLHRDEGLDFSKVTTFNLDEYVGLPPDHEQSYHAFMWRHLFDHINVDPRFVHIPHGMADDVPAFCDWYEERIAEAGGIDLQILGIGANGHIAFNEPSSSLGSRTRIKTLTPQTREDNARFFGSLDDVPRYAITMGVGTIMEARQLLLLASGSGKADAIADTTVEGPISARVPASIVQLHRDAVVLVDRDAAARLELEYIG
ncbi:MAG: glucosamine-6-phosphate deaminase [Gemmatimonadetes bacterium]|nr:glucosamine-6-phosphate deaminase [Gemmatimonadota bacterium]NIQ57313.1 glucosamine-6-phosphate deaminase [Gemmatimonadota bacterium]NIU77471.1 glucosamine-6-phosphate deaminase [Gammaproteobacteria bacterium]NIX46694.1 glucosamine-6-phosphate deaminase [Gemmatimonadota bacterium]NIY11037.1 glucosamine-6-phosphate deaminase [Gemmatimonadota bacterium]